MSPPSLRTLLRHSDVSLAIYSLKSVVAYSLDPVRLVIHEDGSLTDEDRHTLFQEFPTISIINRAHADDVMDDLLSNYPHTRSYRSSQVFGLKLLDIVLLGDNYCFYMDSDIAFFRSFKGLFNHKAVAGRCVFLRDTVWHAYSIRPWHLTSHDNLQVASGMNTGLTLCDRSLFDLDFIEWFLSHPEWRVFPGWTEMTCWAALALRANGHAVQPQQLTNLYPTSKFTSATVGAHFLGSYRSRWKYLLNRPLVPNAEHPAEIKFELLKPLTAFSLSINTLKRKLQNFTPLFKGY